MKPKKWCDVCESDYFFTLNIQLSTGRDGCEPRAQVQTQNRISENTDLSEEERSGADVCGSVVLINGFRLCISSLRSGLWDQMRGRQAEKQPQCSRTDTVHQLLVSLKRTIRRSRLGTPFEACWQTTVNGHHTHTHLPTTYTHSGQSGRIKDGIDLGKHQMRTHLIMKAFNPNAQCSTGLMERAYSWHKAQTARESVCVCVCVTGFFWAQISD